MLKFKKNYKKLYKSYKKLLKDLNFSNINSWQDPTKYFIAYLKMIRDYRLLATSDITKIEENDAGLAALITAISEYELSQSCFFKYYKVENGIVSRIVDTDEETTLKKYSQEKLFHWEAFWNIVKMSIEDWVV